MIDVDKLSVPIMEYLDKRRKVYPCLTNRASEIGHQCVRYLVFNRTRWQDRLLHDVRLERIFEEGRMHEEAVVTMLRNSGFEVSQQQRDFHDRAVNISGHLDFFIAHPNVLPRAVPAECKGLSEFNFSSINSLEDMVSHKRHYVRKYPAQLMIYLYLSEHEEGVFVLKNKLTGEIKFVYVAMNFDYVESLLKKAEKVNEYVAKDAIPQETVDVLEICRYCPFRHLCFKDQDFGPGLTILDDSLLVEKVNRMLSLETTAKEYDELKQDITDSLKAKAENGANGDPKAEFMFGEYVARMSRVSSTKYSIPKEVKEGYAQKYEYWKLNSIIKV